MNSIEYTSNYSSLITISDDVIAISDDVIHISSDTSEFDKDIDVCENQNIISISSGGDMSDNVNCVEIVSISSSDSRECAIIVSDVSENIHKIVDDSHEIICISDE